MNADQAGWDAYWRKQQQTGYVNYTPELLDAIRCVGEISGKRLLEIGCGTGGNAVMLAGSGAEMVLLDLSAEALAVARQTARRCGVQAHLVQANARAIPFADSLFDGVYHQGVLEHFREPSLILAEQGRVLRPGGLLAVDVPQRYNLYTLKKHLLMALGKWEYGWETSFSYGSLCWLLIEAGFEVIAAYGRGYYPAPFRMLRHLRKIEERLGRNGLLPRRFWECYESPWRRFEAGRSALYLLQCIGVVGRK